MLRAAGCDREWIACTHTVYIIQLYYLSLDEFTSQCWVFATVLLSWHW